MDPESPETKMAVALAFINQAAMRNNQKVIYMHTRKEPDWWVSLSSPEPMPTLD